MRSAFSLTLVLIAAMLRIFLLATLALLALVLTACTGGGSVFLDGPVVGAGDTKAPTIAIKNVTQGTTAIPGEPFTVAVTDEASTLANVQIIYNGNEMVNQGYDAYSIAVKYEVGAPVGPQTLQVLATDAAGNESSQLLSFTVVETHHAF